jgi:superfamily II DNA or RNA helicase
MQLRQYQEQSVKGLSEGFKEHQRQVLCLPTGAGKTIVFSSIVEQAARRGTVTLVLTDRTELFKQTVKALGKFKIVVEEISPKRKQVYKGATVYVGMVETLKRRKELLDELPIKLIICDEAHKQNFNTILDAFPEAFTIGATATPVGKHFYKYYSNIVHPIDVPELVDNGFLVPCKPFQMVDDFSDLEVKRGDYTTKSLGEHFQKTTIYDGVVQWWKQKAMGKKTIVFNCSIEHSETVTEFFNNAGISSESITSKTSPEERKRILEAFSSGAFSVLNNCGILTTGYDEPTIGCVILNRATESLPLFLQMIGEAQGLLMGKQVFYQLGKKGFFQLRIAPNQTLLF